MHCALWPIDPKRYRNSCSNALQGVFPVFYWPFTWFSWKQGLSDTTTLYNPQITGFSQRCMINSQLTQGSAEILYFHLPAAEKYINNLSNTYKSRLSVIILKVDGNQTVVECFVFLNTDELCIQRAGQMIEGELKLSANSQKKIFLCQGTIQ